MHPVPVLGDVAAGGEPDAIVLSRIVEKLARIVRYGAEEIVEYDGQVPTGMAFLVAGRVRLTATAEDGSTVSVGTLGKGSFLGVTALTRQPNPGGAYALEEVTAVEIDREHLERVVMSKPVLLQDLGRLIDERQDKAREATHRERVG
jgi:CRP-like cAMP-binding protein